MNFQAIQQIKGQKEGNYPKRLDMYAVLNEIKGLYYNTNQTPCTDCVITDTVGEKHKVIIYKDGPPARLIGTQQVFSLYAYDGTYTDKITGQQKSYTGYSGFWVDNPQRHQQAGQQSSSQTPQTPPQQANLPQGIDIIQIAERIACALEKIANKGQSFEEKYNLNEEEGDCLI